MTFSFLTCLYFPRSKPMAEPCHVAVLPFTFFGHMIPMVDMSVLLASRGAKVVIITPKSAVDRFSKAIEQTIHYDHQITVHIIEVKATEAAQFNILDVISGYKEPVEKFLEESQPNCVIADSFYSFITKSAEKFNVPRIHFDPTGFFSKSVADVIRIHEPEKNVTSATEPFIVPLIPDGQITFTKNQLMKVDAERFKMYKKFVSESAEADVTIVNTFYELEPEYARFFREVLKRKAWHVGPVSLCCKKAEDKLERGKKSIVNEHECLKWLDSKEENSVVYISFGTMVRVADSQLYEIAMGIEASNVNFIWVIKKEQENSIPKGFEERMKANGKGMIIKGWAPQVLILDHESVGGFMTHNGWNSTLEGVCAGVAMVTWPVNAEQFFNAKLVTDVLKVGVPIGYVEWSETSTVEGVKREAIQKALERVMSPEEGGEMRRRAKILKERAKAAVEEGGSSYSDVTSFIDEMKEIKSRKISNGV